MNDNGWQGLCVLGLRFFGKITASITHELKNHLATAKEQAGLMSDLIAISAQGRPLDTDRLDRLTQNIRNRIAKTDEVIKRLNQFAHSIDTDRESMDFNEVVQSMVTMCQRLAGQKGVELVTEPYSAPLIVENHPFFLRQAIFACLNQALEAAGQRGLVKVVIEGGGGQIRCLFIGRLSQPMSVEGAAGFLNATLKDLLGAVIETEASGGLCLRLPLSAPVLS